MGWWVALDGQISSREEHAHARTQGLMEAVSKGHREDGVEFGLVGSPGWTDLIERGIKRNTKGRRERGEVRWLEHSESEIWYLFIQFNAYGVTTL